MLRVGTFTKHHTLVSQVFFYASVSIFLHARFCVCVQT